MPPQFRMDLYYSYHQSQGHDTDRCTALRHAIQDVIDRGSIGVDQLGIVADHMIVDMVPSTSDPHSTSHVEDDDTQMMSIEGARSDSFTEDMRSFGG